MSSGLKIAAHMAAVPSNGHDSGRAERWGYTKANGLGR